MKINQITNEGVQSWAARAVGKIAFKKAYAKALELLDKEIERGGKDNHSVEYYAGNLLRMLRGGDNLDPKELAAMYRKQYAMEDVEVSEAETGTTAKVYKTNGKYWVVDVKNSKIDYTDWGPTGAGFDSKEDAEAFAKQVTKEGLEEDEGEYSTSDLVHIAHFMIHNPIEWGNAGYSLKKDIGPAMISIINNFNKKYGEYGSKWYDAADAAGKPYDLDAFDNFVMKYIARTMKLPLASVKSYLNEQREGKLEEGPIAKALGAVALIASLWGVNNHMAQQAYDASPQLQKLTAYLEVAKQHNDQRMIDQLTARIENHKARLDLGKGDVMGADGKPVNVVYDKDMGEAKDPCWKGYKQIGMKKKGKKEVPNCVPKD